MLICKRALSSCFASNDDFALLKQNIAQTFILFVQSESIILKVNLYASQRSELNIGISYDCANIVDF